MYARSGISVPHDRNAPQDALNRTDAYARCARPKPDSGDDRQLVESRHTELYAVASVATASNLSDYTNPARRDILESVEGMTIVCVNAVNVAIVDLNRNRPHINLKD
jgi:hypothetical protein